MIVKVRQDAWSHEDDLLLAESVLRHIRDGSTQLRAFDEVGDILNRTSAACGFRWNAEVRKKYIQAVDLAKRQRKDKKRALAKEQVEQQQEQQQQPYSLPKPVSTQFDEEVAPLQNYYEETRQELEQPQMNLQSVISFLESIEINGTNEKQLQIEIEQLKTKNNRLLHQNSELENSLQQVQEQLATVQADYQSFINIMERARQMSSFESATSNPTQSFQTSHNSHLEQIIHETN